MKVNKTSKYVLSFEADEVTEALIHWLSRGSKSTSHTINIASLMNNSECTITSDHESTFSVSFEWDEKTDESW